MTIVSRTIRALTAIVMAASLLPNHAAPIGTNYALPAEAAPASSATAPTADGSEVSGLLNADERAVTLAGDATGLRLLTTASGADNWTQLATLAVPGVETSQWVGNFCVTGDGTKVAVVYGAREVLNDDGGLQQGGHAAIVDVKSGAIRTLGDGYTLAYFNPSCERSRYVTLSGFDQEQTYVGVVDAVDETDAPTVIKTDGQVTAPVTSSTRNTYAVVAEGIASLAPTEPPTVVIRATDQAFDLRVDGADRLLWLEASNDQATVRAFDPTLPTAGPHEIVSGPLTAVGLLTDAQGAVYVTGVEASSVAEGSGVTPVPGAPSDTITSDGSLVLEQPTVQIARDGTPLIDVLATNVADGSPITDVVELDRDDDTPSAMEEPSGASPTVAGPATPTVRFATTSSTFLAGHRASEDNSVRTCAVARNDPASQVLQPKPRQVEWAVDRAVAGELTIQRPANWNGSGMSAYSPQGMFPRIGLTGGGQIPPQVLLGILAQESNLWQASRYTSPGETGNPLIGNYYGNGSGWGANHTRLWTVSWGDADCGYGVGQITDGMRLAGKENLGLKEDEPRRAPALPVAQQRAIALDYAANVAKATQMLEQKWNETRAMGLTVNNGDSSRIENWYFAVWAYNTGVYARTASGPWGIGWLNNPMNPMYPANRGSFLNGSSADAAHPQDWAYPERVMGFAAHSLDLTEKWTPDQVVTVSGFRTAWWNEAGAGGDANRALVQAPRTLFCSTTVNQCDPSRTAAPCLRQDSKCWWNGPVTWKPNCDTTCGYGFNRFTPASSYMSEQPNGESVPANCSRTGLPNGALVVDDARLDQDGSLISYPPARPGCTAATTNGTFSLDLGVVRDGSHPSAINLHQLGGGFNAHFYFTHTRNLDHVTASHVVGTWTLDRSLSQWTRVMVHIPDHAAWSQNAVYIIKSGTSVVGTRSVQQRVEANRWVSLGVFQMNGVPSVTLSNIDPTRPPEQNGEIDIAWDAVAFQPLAAKPRDFVVALGDSFSSGEGAGGATGSNFSRSSDNKAGSEYGNNCHRASTAWSRKAETPRVVGTTIGARADALDTSLDYHLLACSGAQSHNLFTAGTAAPNGGVVAGQHHEVTQLDMGYLDANTTLVTLTIGGNDVGFADVIRTCVTAGLSASACTDQESTIVAKINTLKSSLGVVFDQIRLKAPNAKIVILGYPGLFAEDAGCIGLGSGKTVMLRRIQPVLNAAIADAVTSARGRHGDVVKFADPTQAFAGKEVCRSGSAINGFVLSMTRGDTGFGKIGWPGEDIRWGISSQSLHPNDLGTSLYASVLTAALKNWY